MQRTKPWKTCRRRAGDISGATSVRCGCAVMTLDGDPRSAPGTVRRRTAPIRPARSTSARKRPVMPEPCRTGPSSIPASRSQGPPGPSPWSSGLRRTGSRHPIGGGSSTVPAVFGPTPLRDADDADASTMSRTAGPRSSPAPLGTDRSRHGSGPISTCSAPSVTRGPLLSDHGGGGANGTRTRNPLLAKQVRYQLRHSPD